MPSLLFTLGRLLRIPLWLPVLWLLLGTTQAHGRVEIEKAMREYQARHFFVTGGYVTWPDCACGDNNGPPPPYPADGLYGDLDLNYPLATNLIAVLYQQCFSSYASIHDFFLDVPDTVGSPTAGNLSYPVVTFGQSHAIAAQRRLEDMTKENYPEYLREVWENYLYRLKYLKIEHTFIDQAGKSVSNMDLVPDPYIYPSGDCGPWSNKASRIDAYWLTVPWTQGYNPQGGISQIASWDSHYVFTDNRASLASGRGKIYCPVKEEVTLVYGNQPNQKQSVFLYGYEGEFFVYLNLGIGNNGAGQGLPPVTSPYGLSYFSLLDSSTFPGTYTSAEFGNGKQDWPSTCPIAIPSGYEKGWWLNEALVILKPDFRGWVSEGSCGVCANCAPGKVESVSGGPALKASLGVTSGGNHAGVVYLEPLPATGAMAQLSSVHLLADPEVAPYMAQGTLRQILANTTLVDCVSNTPTRYNLSFYEKDSAYVAAQYNVPVGAPFKILTVEQAATNANELIVTQTENGRVTVSHQLYVPAESKWEKWTEGDPRIEINQDIWNAAHTQHTNLFLISSNRQATVYLKQQVYQNFPWGSELVEETLGDGTNRLTQTFVYGTNALATDNTYRRLKCQTNTLGQWTQFQYDAYGRPTNETALFGPPGSSDTQNLLRIYSTNLPQVTLIEKVKGIEVSRKYVVYTNGLVRQIACQNPGDAYNHPSNLVTELKRERIGNHWRTTYERQPDQTVTFRQYYWDSGSNWISLSRTGEPNSSTNPTEVLNGIETKLVQSASGFLTQRVTSDILNGAVNFVLARENLRTDRFGRPTQTTALDGTSITRSYQCCGVDWEKDAEGVITTYDYDSLGRIRSVARQGVTTTRTYDSANHVIQEVQTSGTVSITNGMSAYDRAGRMIRHTNATGHVTAYQYYQQGGWTYKKTLSAWNTTNENYTLERYSPQGRLQSVSGTAVRPETYEDEVQFVENVWRKCRTTVHLADTTNQWQREIYLGNGQLYKKQYADNTFDQWMYNNKNQLERQIFHSVKENVYEYNNRSVLEKVTLKAPVAASDRITRTIESILPLGHAQNQRGCAIRRVQTWVWTEEAPNGVCIKTVDEAVDGTKRWIEEKMDSRTLSTSEISERPAEGIRITTTTFPDQNRVVRTFANAQMTYERHYDSAGQLLKEITYGYDEFGRLTSISEPLSGKITYVHNPNNQVTNQTVHSRLAEDDTQTLTYNYDALGRLTQLTYPDQQAVHYYYFTSGDLQKVSGARTYPTEFQYDAQGRMTNLVMNNAGGNPATSWQYDPANGYLVAKQWPDQQSAVLYTNNSLGQAIQVAWVQGTNRLVLTNQYTFAGELESVSYNNKIAATFAYDRRGRLKEVVSKGLVSGDIVNRLFYNDRGQKTGESYAGGLLQGYGITNQYNSRGQRTFFGVIFPSGYCQLRCSYAYDSAGRLETVTADNWSRTFQARYVYFGTTSRVKDLLYTCQGQETLRVSKVYDGFNRLQSILARPKRGDLWEYTYAYNAAGLRQQELLHDNSYWQYDYDALGQLTNAARYWEDRTAVAGQKFTYSYDASGNRLSSAQDSQLSTYTVNALNQYTSRTQPGSIQVMGLANPDAQVVAKANGINYPTTRHGEYFHGLAYANNTNGPVSFSAGVEAYVPGGHYAGQTGTAKLSAAQSVLKYDYRGNLLEDGLWRYEWDGQNRLIWIGSLIPGYNVSYEMFYDALGRLIFKSRYQNGSCSWNLRYIYDGWLLVAVVNADYNYQKYLYVWGLDQSGTIGGAGGVGGLLGQIASYDAYQAVSDGKGHVVGWVKSSDGSRTTLNIEGEGIANAEYGPFGETIRDVPVMGFSSKYTDSETGLIYYGYRYYSPTLGRWLSRDPIEENGGHNLYSFVLNNPLSILDILGLEPYGSFELSLRDVDYKNETLKGFQVKYVLDENAPCPCRKKENIVVVQAVDDPLFSPRFDVSEAQRKQNMSTRGGIPVPAYVDGAYYNQDPFLIVDAPLLQNSEINNGTWKFEDCAICRHKFKDGTWNDQILGCVKYTFKRVKQGQVELIAESGGKTLKGQSLYRVKAEDPGSTWTTASTTWHNEAGH